MTLTDTTHGEDIEGWSSIAMNLCKLRMASEGAQEFAKRFSKHLDQKDKVELAALNTKYDCMYYKYWERLVRKIRGI